MASSVLFVLAAVFAVANAAKLPSSWKVCKRSLPPAEYEVCIQDALKSAVEDLTKNGAPSLNIPPIEPLKITALEIGKGSGPVAVQIFFQDMELSNLNTANVTAIRHKDAEKYKMGADLAMSKPLIVKAKYELEGKVLVLPIKGKGNCNLSFDNFRTSFDLAGSPLKKKSGDYVKIDTFDIDFSTSKFHLNFENLFDGNKELGDNMNKFLNENSELILLELKPAIIEAISQAFKAIANQVFTQVPYREILPP